MTPSPSREEALCIFFRARALEHIVKAAQDKKRATNTPFYKIFERISQTKKNRKIEKVLCRIHMDIAHETDVFYAHSQAGGNLFDCVFFDSILRMTRASLESTREAMESLRR